MSRKKEVGPVESTYTEIIYIEENQDVSLAMKRIVRALRRVSKMNEKTMPRSKERVVLRLSVEDVTILNGKRG